ncbi:efflux RND transporter permease subunit [Aestuariirhabdus litorea]|uniref:Efflux RND transporter permease subunit n=1 Tax=Aestuariirhabdus litorea TaxID=2528527 RepID=A0A3P3VLZ2_9GAMM|nr:efflux RND transporter permease subunit [Aestuariirhabdus litorea]RRJ83782.1 efflux RND transporter permease subunit [Aestuariirhabdus litorea]RWW97005.1 efflux RND transporter permease subunit [Endozoicomonadaceae bacterium GTF-13]
MIRSFVANGRLVSLVIAILVVAGLGALKTLPRSEDPRITSRVATVITAFPGTSAERVEALVTEPIENRLRKLSEIKLITSTSRPGISLVRLELKDEVVEPDPIWSKARDLLGEVERTLPAGAGKPSLDDDRGYAFTRIIALKWRGPGDLDLATLGRYGKELQSRMRALSGTDYVEVYGEPVEEVLVEIDQHLASTMGLTPETVSARIAAADAKVTAGRLVNDNNQLQVELEGALDSLERIRSIPLRTDAQGFVYRVGDLARVERSIQWPQEELALVEGDTAVVVAVRMGGGQRIDLWGARVDREQERFESLLPGNVELEVLFDQSGYTNARLGGLVENVLIGFAIISLVLLLTLGWRSAIIVASSLPLTVLFTLACMNYYGLPIHQMSVTGLVVALGIMVDNAIVMVDSIQFLRQKGRSAIDAVMESVHHLWLPLLGSTLTTILAFMPIVLMPGGAGEFVGGIALSVIFSLVGSYLISHSLVAGLAGRFLKAGHAGEHWYHRGLTLPWLSRGFQRSLELALRRPWLTLLLVSLVPLAGFRAAGELTEQFFPASDRDMFQIELFLPSQTSLSATRRMTDAIGVHLNQQEEIESVQWFVGNNAPSFYYNLIPAQQGAQNYAQAMVKATDFKAANRVIPALQRMLDERFPEAQILVRKLEQGPPFDAPVEVRIYGPSLDTLKQLGDKARAILAQTESVVHTRATLQPGTPKVWLSVNEESSLQGGMTLTAIAGQLRNALEGSVQGSVLESTESIPVRVRVANELRRQPGQLGDISITPTSGASVPLSALTQVEIEPSRGAIPRRDGERVNTIAGYLRAGVLPATALAAYQRELEAAEFTLPTGYRLEIGGESAKRDEAVGNLLVDIGVIITLLVTVLVLSFNSFRLSALILVTAIQAAGLGLLSLYLFDFAFGFNVIIGLLGLMGLAINAAIVILAELKSSPEAARGEPAAIVHGVGVCTRHITSTTITTLGGFMPLILEGGGFWPPFAVAVAGGTLLTTLLSFYFVPAAFVLMSRYRPFVATEPGTTAEVGA